MQIPIFFSVTTAAGQRSLSAAIASLQTHANLNHTYHIHILNDALAQKQPRSLNYLQRENFLIKFSPSVSSVLEIPALFPEYDKAIVLDSSLLVAGDISLLWNEPLGNRLAGAVAEGEEQLDRVKTGVLLLNCKKLRENPITLDGENDRDRLNSLPRKQILFLDPDWNAPAGENLEYQDDNPQILHFRPGIRRWQYKALIAALG